jgi:hypothetical protein
METVQKEELQAPHTAGKLIENAFVTATRFCSQGHLASAPEAAEQTFDLT